MVIGSLVSSSSGETQKNGGSAPLDLALVLFNDGNVPIVVSPRLVYRMESEIFGESGICDCEGSLRHADDLVLAPGASRVFRFVGKTSKQIVINNLNLLDSTATPNLEAYPDPDTNEITFDLLVESRIGRKKLQLKYGCSVINPIAMPLDISGHAN